MWFMNISYKSKNIVILSKLEKIAYVNGLRHKIKKK